MQVYQPSAFLTRVAVLRVNPFGMGRCTIRGISPLLGIRSVEADKKQAAFGWLTRENPNERHSPFFLKRGLPTSFPVWSGVSQRGQVLSNR